VLLVTPGDAVPRHGLQQLSAQRLSRRALVCARPASDRHRKRGGRSVTQWSRYWLMNANRKNAPRPRVTKTFGGIEMIQQAPSAVLDEPAPYSVNEVSRHTVFVFNAGEQSTNSSIPTDSAGSCRAAARSRTPNCRAPTCPALPAGSTADRMDLPAARAHRHAARRHHNPPGPRHPGRLDEQLLAGGLNAIRYPAAVRRRPARNISHAHRQRRVVCVVYVSRWRTSPTGTDPGSIRCRWPRGARRLAGDSVRM